MQRRGRSFWGIAVEELGRSGLSHTAFADQRGLSVGTLRRWLYRFRAERVESTPLLPVRVVASTAPTARWQGGTDGLVEVELPTGVRLRFPTGTDDEYVAALAKRLG
jgi:hypothetical protein